VLPLLTTSGELPTGRTRLGHATTNGCWKPLVVHEVGGVGVEGHGRSAAVTTGPPAEAGGRSSICRVAKHHTGWAEAGSRPLARSATDTCREQTARRTRAGRRFDLVAEVSHFVLAGPSETVVHLGPRVPTVRTDMTDYARRQGPTGRRLRVAAVVLAAAGLTVACGSEDPTQMLPTEVFPGRGIEGLDSCAGGELPVAAFWGSTEGVGSPGRGPDSPPGGDLFGMSSDGEIRRLTDDAKSRDPWLSHDGRRLYFTRSDGGTLAGGAAPGTSVWVRGLDTGEDTMVFEVADREGAQVAVPEASPDGSRIVFQATNEEMFDRVYVLELGGELREIAMPISAEGLQGWQTEPTWRPDGEQLAYLYTEVDDTGQRLWSSIRVVDLASSEEAILYAPAEPVTLVDLEWTADGEALTANQLAGQQVISIDLASGRQTTLADGVNVSATASGEGAFTGIGPEHQAPAGEEPTRQVLATWNGADVAVRELPEAFSFATYLTIADCAFHRED